VKKHHVDRFVAHSHLAFLKKNKKNKKFPLEIDIVDSLPKAPRPELFYCTLLLIGKTHYQLTRSIRFNSPHPLRTHWGAGGEIVGTHYSRFNPKLNSADSQLPDHDLTQSIHPSRGVRKLLSRVGEPVSFAVEWVDLLYRVFFGIKGHFACCCGNGAAGDLWSRNENVH
jgi:hypothetical protein